MNIYSVGLKVSKMNSLGMPVFPSLTAYIAVNAAHEEAAKDIAVEQVSGISTTSGTAQNAELKMRFESVSCIKINETEARLLTDVNSTSTKDECGNLFLVDVLMEQVCQDGMLEFQTPAARLCVKSRSAEQAMLDALLWHSDGHTEKDIRDWYLHLKNVRFRAAFVMPVADDLMNHLFSITCGVSNAIVIDRH